MTMTNVRQVTATFIVAAVMAVAPGSIAAQTSAACQGRPTCAEVQSFTANVNDFRMSQGDRNTHLMTITVRFQNKTTRPLILGYVRGSGVGTDDQGNRYEVAGANSVRGIGEISSSFDPKFVLQPGEWSDARFELVYQSPAGRILGTRYEIDLTVRQIDPLAAGQFRLGREHALHFRGFGAGAAVASNGAASPASGAAPAPLPSSPAAAAANSPLPADVDQCAGKARCYGAGPFVAEVEQVTATTEGNKRYHVLHMNVRVRNVSQQPMILAYKATSGLALDNLGNRYYWGHAGGPDNSAAGIGKVEGSNADPQFQLAAGEGRTAQFTVVRFDANGREIGTSFTYDLTLTQLEVLPSRQIRVSRDYAVSFKDLGSNAADQGRAAGNAAASRLIDALRKKVGKP